MHTYFVKFNGEETEVLWPLLSPPSTMLEVAEVWARENWGVLELDEVSKLQDIVVTIEDPSGKFHRIGVTPELVRVFHSFFV